MFLFFFIASLTTTLQLKVWRPIYSLHILVQSAPLRNRNGGGWGRHTMEGRTGQECNDSEDPWSSWCMITSGGEKTRGISASIRCNELVFWTSDILDYCFLKNSLFLGHFAVGEEKLPSWTWSHTIAEAHLQDASRPQSRLIPSQVSPGLSEGQGTGAFFFFFVMLLLPHSMRLPTFYPQDDREYKKASEQKEQRVAPSKMNINSLRTGTLVLLLALLWTECLCPTDSYMEIPPAKVIAVGDGAFGR